MPDATVVTLEAQLDALAARIATLEWRHERLLKGLTRAAERLSESGLEEPASSTAGIVASTAAMQQQNDRSARVRELEEQDRQKQIEQDRDETLRDLTRRLGRLEAKK